jgi:ribosomal protein S18 acetylase RimI-like enzyme
MPPTGDIVIDYFRPEDLGAFASLNRAWLTEHGLIEPADEWQLADPLGRIVGAGGQIFVARRGAEVVGTCAVVPHGPGELELVKLAVAPVARGLGLGRRLAEACLAFARAQGAARVVLLSNTRLASALRLYERLGFRRAPVPPGAQYVTADVYMELDLPQQLAAPAGNEGRRSP